MNWIPVLAVVAVTLGICFLADKGFAKLFRSKSQHQSGLSVKASKRNATFGLVACALGVAAVVNASQGVLMVIAGIVMLLLGICLIVYFLSFGIYYDDESFIYSTFGKKSKAYKFEKIMAQQLYASGSGIIIELHLCDGQTIQLQSSMSGIDGFMDKAFNGWLKQKGLTLEDCPFYDPEKSHWFPNAQEE